MAEDLSGFGTPEAQTLEAPDLSTFGTPEAAPDLSAFGAPEEPTPPASTSLPVDGSSPGNALEPVDAGGIPTPRVPPALARLADRSPWNVVHSSPPAGSPIHKATSDALRSWYEGALGLAGDNPVKQAALRDLYAQQLAQHGVTMVRDTADPLSTVGKALGTASSRGMKVSQAAIGDLASKVAGVPAENLSSFAEDPEAPLPIQKQVKESGDWWRKALGYIGLTGSSLPVLLGTSAAGEMVGVPPVLTNAAMMGFDEQGRPNPVGLAAAFGIPIVDQWGRQITSDALTKLIDQVKVVRKEMTSPGVFAAELENLGLIKKLGLNKDSVLKALELGGGQAADNAYLLALQTPGILTSDNPKEALLEAVAGNLAMSVAATPGALKGTSETFRRIEAKARQGLWPRGAVVDETAGVGDQKVLGNPDAADLSKQGVPEEPTPEAPAPTEPERPATAGDVERILTKILSPEAQANLEAIKLRKAAQAAAVTPETARDLEASIRGNQLRPASGLPEGAGNPASSRKPAPEPEPAPSAPPEPDEIAGLEPPEDSAYRRELAQAQHNQDLIDQRDVSIPEDFPPDRGVEPPKASPSPEEWENLTAPEPSRDLKDLGVTDENIRALKEGTMTPEEVVSQQMGITKNGNQINASTLDISENEDGTRNAAILPSAGIGAHPPKNIGSMSHEDAILMAFNQAVDDIRAILPRLRANQPSSREVAKAEQTADQAPKPVARRRVLPRNAPDRDPDIIQHIVDHVGTWGVLKSHTAPRSTALGGEYDSGDYQAFRRTAWGRRLLSAHGRVAPDQAINTLMHQGLVGPDYTADDLWRDLYAATQARKAPSAQSAEAKYISDQIEKAETFQKEAVRKSAGKKKLGLKVTELGIGDTFKVAGHPFKVAKLHFDDHDNLESVEVEDGRRFGVQTIDADHYLLPDQGSYKPNPVEDPFRESDPGYELTERSRGRNLPGLETKDPNQLDFDFAKPLEAASLSLKKEPSGVGKEDGKEGSVLRPVQLSLPQIRRVASQIVQEIGDHGGIEITGRQIKSHAEAAVLFQLFRNPQFEIFHWVLTKGGVVVGRYATTARLPGVTYAFAGKDTASAITDLMQKLQADGYWMVHNHPSGFPDPSNADLRVTRELAGKIPGFKGHVVINHTRYAMINASGHHTIWDLPGIAPGTPDPLLSGAPPTRLGKLLGTPLNSQSDVALFSKRLQAQDPELVSLMFKTSRGTLRTLGEVSLDDFLSADFPKVLRQHALASGAASVVAYAPAGPREGEFKRAGFRYVDTGVLDDAYSPAGGVPGLRPNPDKHWLGQRHAGPETALRVHEGRTPDDQAGFLARMDDLIRQQRDAKRKGDVQRAAELEAQIAKMEKERFGYSARPAQGELDTGAQPPPPKPPGQEQLDYSERQATLDIAGATTAPKQTPSEWWESVKRGFRMFATQTPEIPLTGEKALRAVPFHRFMRLTEAKTEQVRRDALERVHHIVEPLLSLGRLSHDPNTLEKFRKFTDLIQGERAKAKPDSERIDEWVDKREALAKLLEKNPLFLFQQEVIFRDLWYRTNFITTPNGGQIQPPAGLTPEGVEKRLRQIEALIDSHPESKAIYEALKRHYEFVGEIAKDLETHGEIIPEELKNPMYFPHHLLEGWTGRLQKVRVSTEGDFRYYLIPPTGTAKLHQADYLQAMYKHAADVLAHNARMDLVEKYVKPYDISKRVQADLEAAAELDGNTLPPDAWKWEKNRPAGYALFTPSEVLPLSASYIIDRATLSNALGAALTDGDLVQQLRAAGLELKITAEDIQKALTVGEKLQWLIPEEIADALKHIKEREDRAALAARGAGRLGPVLGALSRANKQALNIWRWNVLFNPLNYVRYEINNSMTDIIDKVFGLDPGLAMYIPQAMREIRAAAQGDRTPEYEAAFSEGVLQTVTASEAAELHVLKPFEEVLSDRKQAVNNWNKLWRMTTGTSRLRESVFRYAKFLADVNRMRHGQHPVYGGAYWREVELQPDEYAKAGMISRKTFGDPAELSVAGKFLREHIFPFWSWQEINAKYHANLFRNLYDAIRLGDTNFSKQAARSTAAGVARAAVMIALRLALLRLLVELWNQFGGAATGLWGADEDLEGTLSEADRRKLHIIVGKSKTGKTQVIYLATALSDVGEWIGGNNFGRLLGEWVRGKIDLHEFASQYAQQAPLDIANKLASSVRPDAKFAYTLGTGLEPFPDVTNQRKVNRGDWAWMLGQTVVDRDMFMWLRHFTDPDYFNPESGGEWLQRKILQVRSRDPEQWQYYEIRNLADDWKEAKTGKRHEGGDIQSPDQLVLRNFRKAVYLGDVDSAVKFYERAIELGYTSERFKASLRAQNPLSGLDRSERKEFVESLTPYQQAQLQQAMKFYARLEASRGRESILFPKKPNPQFEPKTDELRRIIETRESMDQDEANETARRLVEQALRGR